MGVFGAKQPLRIKHAIKITSLKVLFIFICRKLSPAVSPNVWLKSPASSAQMKENDTNVTHNSDWFAGELMFFIGILTWDNWDKYAWGIVSKRVPLVCLLVKVGLLGRALGW